MSNFLSKLTNKYQELRNLENDDVSVIPNSDATFAKEVVDATAILAEKIRNSNAPDYISITYDDDILLQKLWGANVKGNNVQVPSDLFFFDTIPLLDFHASVDERGYIKDGSIVNFRIVIFSDYKERISFANDSPVIVGALATDFGGSGEKEPKLHKFYISPIIVRKNIDFLLSYTANDIYTNDCFVGYSAEEISLLKEVMDVKELSISVSNIVSTWYGVQIALLNPFDVYIVKTTKTTINTAKNKKARKDKRRTVKYVRRHYIDSDSLGLFLDGDPTKHGDKRKYKVLAWYVIGHWRHYSDTGKTIFIRGYWKGALRDIKKTADPRNRTVE